MNTHVNRRSVVGILLFLVVAIVAGCAQLPPPETQQEVQKLREQVATLEVRVEESQAAPAPGAVSTDEIMTRMAGLQQRMQEMMQQGTPDPEALAEMQREMADMQQQMQSMMGGMSGSVQSMDMAPPVKGYSAGEEILFIHTEASDPQVANMLTIMMGPQVVLMPRLAEAPESLLASLYVFTNGLQGGGPFGFQPGVTLLPPPRPRTVWA